MGMWQGVRTGLGHGGGEGGASPMSYRHNFLIIPRHYIPPLISGGVLPHVSGGVICFRVGRLCVCP